MRSTQHSSSNALLSASKENSFSSSHGVSSSRLSSRAKIVSKLADSKATGNLDQLCTKDSAMDRQYRNKVSDADSSDVC